MLVWRSLLDPQHELHPHRTGETACKLGAWVDLIGLAQYEDSGGLRRGDIAVSIRGLAQRWHWSRSKVQRFLAELEDQGMVERRGTRAGRKTGQLTISNYDRYQDPRDRMRDTSGSLPYKDERKNNACARTREGARRDPPPMRPAPPDAQNLAEQLLKRKIEA